MPSLATYILGGAMAVLAINFFSPPAGTVAAWPPAGTVAAWPNVAPTQTQQTQSVNRAAKSDRLPVATQVSEQQQQQQQQHQQPQHTLEGCELAFSSLSAAARLNYPGRCLV
jgi:hypothetical protein